MLKNSRKLLGVWRALLSVSAEERIEFRSAAVEASATSAQFGAGVPRSNNACAEIQ